MTLPSHLTTLQTPDGARIAVSLHGGHLCAWRSADGVERLFLSDRTRWNDVIAGIASIRGGIPIVFPQFAGMGPLPKHGLVRTVRWTLLEATPETGLMRLGVTDSAATAQFDGRFSLEIQLRFSGLQLSIDLIITNTGEQPFAFTAALHSYLATPIDTTRIDGLQGQPYLDCAVEPRTPCGGTDTALTVTQEVDRIYAALATPVTLTNPMGALSVRQSGFEDVVVWNPWAEKAAALPDLMPHDERQFVCIEAALIHHPHTLLPGQSWQGQQQLCATPHFATAQGATP
ncbi:D-hexose-6-phosphate mutarotase [Actimicrobium sp. CCI2.3]|uniref:D-hexose-6-phosphate mutarotase n=1 Tax=Actimicrobium sp. CCI2.3 TaxID=3048616 RepID=UPI002AB394F8|nr:D-hexose-6-phosphate mutarotase [Actimicrobium sp. CCI2.3]MDY7574070.1 D-hexose-6-phosphate mutarotase [Actimicrobium sp. CCI2.3]MEB0021822.1 D-hexose-6-phosphate mutarotase [Actimicrobium sp. CCI2.3]